MTSIGLSSQNGLMIVTTPGFPGEKRCLPISNKDAALLGPGNGSNRRPGNPDSRFFGRDGSRGRWPSCGDEAMQV